MPAPKAWQPLEQRLARILAGEVTRAEMERALECSQTQAARLLRRLVKSGEMERIGSGPQARYRKVSESLLPEADALRLAESVAGSGGTLVFSLDGSPWANALVEAMGEVLERLPANGTWHEFQDFIPGMPKPSPLSIAALSLLIHEGKIERHTSEQGDEFFSRPRPEEGES